MNTRKNNCSYAGLLFLGLIIILFFGCSKIDLNSPTNQHKTFDVEDAKEWWFGTFKKSHRFKYFDQQSTFLTMKSNQPESSLKKLTPETRYPSWKSATMHNVGKNIFIQLDLVQAYTSIPIPYKAGETEADRKRIANSTMQKLLLVKLANGQVVERVVTIIPSLDYLKKHNFFNPLKNILAIPDDFSGIVLVRDWNELNKATWLYNNGKRRVLELRKIKIEEQNLIVRNYTPCEPYWGIVDVVRWCIDVHMGNADEPSGYCDDPNNWHEELIYDYIYPDGDCGDNGNPCDYLSYEECQCQTFDLGCEGGGGENPPPPPPPTPCAHANGLTTNTDFKDKFVDLQGKTSDNKEHGFIYNYNSSGGITANPITGQVGAAGISFSVPNPIDGFMHSHYSGLLSIFSSDDIYAMATLYTTNKMVDPSTFTVGVVTANGTQYMLMIDDITKFQQFATNMVSTSLNAFSFAFLNLYNIKPANSNDANEKAFLQFIQQSNSGLRLFKGNNTFNSWQSKKVDANNNVVNNPC